jgi:hypothetical protein
MRLTLAQRREILASMPWVAVTGASQLHRQRCEGFRSGMPLKVRWAIRQPYALDNETLDKWRCTRKARWVFLALDGRIRTFCWVHLFIYGFEGSQEEMERYQAWVDQYNKDHPIPPDWHEKETDQPVGQH